MPASEKIRSLISIPFTVCNVPDPISISAKFVYNFYVSDEDKAYTLTPTSPIKVEDRLVGSDTIAKIEAKERGSLSARVPRYILLNIATLLNPGGAEIKSAEQSDLDDTARNLLSVKGKRANYNIETNVENKFNAGVKSVDSSVSQRLQVEIYRIAESMIEAQGMDSEYSDQMIATTLNGIFSDDVDAALMFDALADNEFKGYRYSNDIKGERYNRFETRKNVQFLSKRNAGVYRDVVKDISTSNPFSGNFLSDLQGSSANQAIRNWILEETIFPSINPGADGASGLYLNRAEIDYEEFEPRLIAASRDSTEVALENVSENCRGYPRIRHVGYIIEKIGKSPQGSIERFEDFVILKPQIIEFIDPAVKYGYTYTYQARQLYIVDLKNIQDSSDNAIVTTATAAIASSPSPPAIVLAVETTPPSAPGVLLCKFMYEEGNGILLEWGRPTNPSRDIKKYQVFRRKSILDPYQLIAEYDFTDSGYTQFDQRENIDPALIRKSAFPVYLHADREFGRDSSYIYAIVSIDAHGYTSGYGVQIQASFDRISNKLNLRRVSQAGAPKAYPNYFIDPTELEEFGSDRLVEDVIKDSGHGRMRLYFNPDAYKVATDDFGDETAPLVLSSERGTYKFQVINLDRQVSKTLTVEISKDSSLNGIL